MRKLYLTVLTVITIFCIIIGSYRNLVYHDHHETYVPSEEYGTYAESAPAMEEEIEFSDDVEFPMDDVNEIYINIKAGSVLIQSDTGYALRSPNEEFVNWTFEDGVLKIDSKNTENFDLTDPSLFDGVPLVHLIVPFDIAVNNLHINVNAGDVTVSGAMIQELDLSCDMGDIHMDTVQLIGSANVHGKMGDIDMSVRSFNDLSVQEDMGNIYFYSDADLTDFEKHCSVKVGSLRVNGSEIGRSFETSGNAGRLTVSNKMGDIDLEWPYSE